ncbi:MAG: DUF86 domain-containing protein [Saprospiraceae bacterium]
MSGNEKKHLFDILNSIREIQEYTTGISAIEDYLKNRMVMRAVERMLSIIGEATNRFEKEVLEEIFSNVRQIVGLRNRLVHTYDDINEAIIWDIVKKHIPVLI